MLRLQLRAAVVLFALPLAATAIRLGQRDVPGNRQLKPLLFELAKEDGFCVTTVGPYMGRLSNVVSQVNRILRMSLEAGASFRFPEKFPEPGREDRLKHEGFEAFFGKEPQCESHKVQVFSPVCTRPRPSEVPGMRGRCFPEELEEAADAWRVEESPLCGCQKLLAVNASRILWDHNYLLTHDILYQRYWSSHGGEPQNSELTRGARGVQVSVHVRLGDLEYNCSAKYSRYNCDKRLGVDAYLAALRALFAVLPPSCAQVNLVTDGTRNSADIQAIAQNFTNTVSKLRIYDKSALSAQQSFDMLARSDVLIFGASGFGEIAAMLSRPSAARVGAPLTPSFDGTSPLKFLPNTTQLHQGVDATTSAALVADNSAVRALAEKCTGL